MVERNGIYLPDCKTHRSRSETKIGHSDPGVTTWMGSRVTDQRYARDNRLIDSQELLSRSTWHLDVDSSHPRAEEGSKGSAVRRLKRYVSWV